MPAVNQRISTPPREYNDYPGQKWAEDVRREINLLQDDVSTAETDIDSLETRVTTAESDIDTLETNKVPYTGATGDVNLGTNKLTLDRLALNASPSTNAVRELFWDAQYGLPSMMVDATNSVTMAIGAEVYMRAVNKTASQINDGQVVYVSGAQGNRPKIDLAKADTVGTSHVIGVATQNIAINAEGFVTLIGEVNGYDTSSFTEGDSLYLSASTAGALTKTAPTSPNNVVVVATALNSTNNGKISVHVHGGLAANTALGSSDLVPPTQNAVKTYVDGVNYWSRSGTTVTPKTAGDNIDAGTGFVVFNKAAGSGVKVDSSSPVYGWADLLGPVRDKSPATAPTFSTYVGTISDYKFPTTAGVKELFFDFHIPHDYLPGSDLYLHVHWSQIAVDSGGPAGVPGNAKWYWDVVYAKGYGTAGGAARGAFSTVITTSIVQQASTTQYGHMIAEVQLSAASPSASQLDSDDIEVDGLIMARLYRDAADASDTLDQSPFVHYSDIHYQTVGVKGTKGRNVPFYT